MRALLLATLLLATPAQSGPVDIALKRVAKLNPKLHAVIALDPTARAQARARTPGPLAGQPVLIKDNIDVAGLPTTAGSLALAANIPVRDAPLVAGLRAAGAVILGKANLSEWANFRSRRSISGWSATGGQARNPHALDRSPCGSSSGSAVAVASGMVRLAIGTETDGSITCPAAANGVVGLKPTVGRVSRSGIVPISDAQDSAGPIAASVREAALLLAAIADQGAIQPVPDPIGALRRDALRGARIGVLRFADRGPGAAMVFEAALAVLRAQGAELVDITDPGIDFAALGEAETLVLQTEFKAGVAAYLAGAPAAVQPRDLAGLIAFNAAHPEELALFDQSIFLAAQATRGLADPAYRAALAKAKRLAGPGGIDRLLARYDVAALVQPTAFPAIPIDPANGDQWPRGAGLGSAAAVAGYPHLTVPMGAWRSLPVGLSFIGPAWSEARLLGFGFAYEQAAGIRIAPRHLRSIDEEPAVAAALRRPASAR